MYNSCEAILLNGHQSTKIVEDFISSINSYFLVDVVVMRSVQLFQH